MTTQRRLFIMPGSFGRFFPADGTINPTVNIMANQTYCLRHCCCRAKSQFPVAAELRRWRITGRRLPPPVAGSLAADPHRSVDHSKGKLDGHAMTTLYISPQGMICTGIRSN